MIDSPHRGEASSCEQLRISGSLKISYFGAIFFSSQYLSRLRALSLYGRKKQHFALLRAAGGYCSLARSHTRFPVQRESYLASDFSAKSPTREIGVVLHTGKGMQVHENGKRAALVSEANLSREWSN